MRQPFCQIVPLIKGPFWKRRNDQTRTTNKTRELWTENRHSENQVRPMANSRAITEWV